MKLLLLLKRHDSLVAESFTERLRGELVPMTMETLPPLRGLSSHIAGEQISMVRGGRGMEAAADGILALQIDSAEVELGTLSHLGKLFDSPAASGNWSALLAEIVGELHAYAVQEVPHWSCTRSWADGEPTPGFKMMALTRRRSGLLREEFQRHYRDVHALLAREHHPALWSYTQNFVSAKLTPDAPDLDCLAEMHFRSVEDLHNGFYATGQSAGIIAKDVAKFMDQRSVRLASVDEVIHRSPKPPERAPHS